VVKGRATFRSFKIRNRKHAVQELFKRRTAAGCIYPSKTANTCGSAHK